MRRYVRFLASTVAAIVALSASKLLAYTRWAFPFAPHLDALLLVWLLFAIGCGCLSIVGLVFVSSPMCTRPFHEKARTLLGCCLLCSVVHCCALLGGFAAIDGLAPALVARNFNYEGGNARVEAIRRRQQATGEPPAALPASPFTGFGSAPRFRYRVRDRDWIVHADLSMPMTNRFGVLYSAGGDASAFGYSPSGLRSIGHGWHIYDQAD